MDLDFKVSGLFIASPTPAYFQISSNYLFRNCCLLLLKGSAVNTCFIGFHVHYLGQFIKTNKSLYVIFQR